MHKSFFTLSLLGLAGAANAAPQDKCEPVPPVCYPAPCEPCYCLGPENYQANAPVCPKTCNGDLIISIAGFYWNAHQDGLEYAIDNEVQSPNFNAAPVIADVLELNNLVDSKYLTPNFEWNFGFKVGLGYCTTCDGWDIGINWTWYRGKADDHVEAEVDDNHTLIALWSAFLNVLDALEYADDIRTCWKLELNLIDIELGRDFWTSRYLSIRPHVGLRIAFIEQDYDLEHRGGSWAAFSTPNAQPSLTNEVCLDNDFKGVGIRAGLDSTWNFGCGWALYGNFAASIVYGRFSIDHDENNYLVLTPFTKTKILETEESFRASRGILDLGLGIQWSTMFCNCSYGFTGMIGWEQHLFFSQNQLWRVNRVVGAEAPLPNNTGENVFHHRRGDLDTQGWTLRFKFEF